MKTEQAYFQLLRLQEFNNLELLIARYKTHVFPRHWNETYVIQIVEQGVNAFYCEGAIHVAPAGSIVLINPYEVHTGYSIGEVPLVYRTLYPTPELLAEIACQLVGRKQEIPFFPSLVIWDARLAQMFGKAHRACETGADQLAAQTQILTALAFLIWRHSDQNISWHSVGKENAPIRRAKEYLDDNFSKNISLQCLAQISHLSPFHFLRSFRKEVGLPPHEYLINVRIERAKALLAKGRPIVQVAYETGFADQSHLHRQFKRIVGITPEQYIS